jgi:hypothetical protein
MESLLGEDEGWSRKIGKKPQRTIIFNPTV